MAEGWTSPITAEGGNAATRVQFDPLLIEYRSVLPGAVGPEPGFGVAYVGTTAPTDAIVTATIVDDPVRFHLSGISSTRKWTRPPTRLEIEELPAMPAYIRERARLSRIEEFEQVAVSHGEPFAITRGLLLAVGVQYTAVDLIPGRDLYTANLIIAGDTWEPVSIQLILLVAQVETRLRPIASSSSRAGPFRCRLRSDRLSGRQRMWRTCRIGGPRSASSSRRWIRPSSPSAAGRRSPAP